ncbi:hypothetical protein M011DRAFT_469056 [Sporormia fimetaria CBS 119925]|uniref:CREG-like beta-barrel domain-containing protein n=1 Tax=Sporormia fimetaria CBS 119925 TaxID=1340428 RepID=A0A6A6V7U7_9PLEO|nr:hypothetical protein M011DRAFT_469056 [Sporormia fimetaria CBS 119925]
MMHIPTFLVSLLPLASAAHLPQAQHIFTNPASPPTTGFKIPTVHESAVQARRILRLERIGTLSTIFPNNDHPNPHHGPPSSVSGTPIGLMDYFADCEPQRGDPTILAINIATSFRNVAAGSNITLSLRWHPPNKQHYSAAAIPRFSLVGYLENIKDEDVVKGLLPACFVKYHPDAAAWLPGNPIHTSHWTRLVVQEVYWIGGFGDRAYIGWIPLEEWQSVTEDEIQSIRLPDEQSGGWGFGMVKEWMGLGGSDNQESWEL